MIRSQLITQKIKKCGSEGDDSDRSISPSEIIEVKENKPLIQRIPLNKRSTKGDVKSGIATPKSVTKSTSKIATIKQPTPHHSKPQLNSTNKKLFSPRVGIKAKSPSAVNRCTSPSIPYGDNPSWKMPSSNAAIGKPSPIRSLPGRGGPKKQRKVYNPATLLSMCRTAVNFIIPEPEVAADTKDFVKRRLYNHAVLGAIWETLTKETKKNRLSIENLISERDALSAELTELKGSLDTKITTLTSRHDKVLSSTKQKLLSHHSAETKKLRKDYDATIADLREQLSSTTECHNTELVCIREAHGVEMETLYRDHENQRNQLIAAHDDHAKRLEQTQKDLEEQNDYLDTQLREKDESVMAEVEEKLQQQVQRYSTINAELQSLRDVIDMKSNENKKLLIENTELKIKSEEAGALRQEICGLRDMNEQLRATLDMKTESERNLNMTQESLKDEIIVRKNDAKKSANKCEELQYKLFNYEELLYKNNLHDNMPSGGSFIPHYFSTPSNSPVRPADNIDLKQQHNPSPMRSMPNLDTKPNGPTDKPTDKQKGRHRLSKSKRTRQHSLDSNSNHQPKSLSWDIDSKSDVQSRPKRTRANSAQTPPRSTSPSSFTRVTIGNNTQSESVISQHATKPKPVTPVAIELNRHKPIQLSNNTITYSKYLAKKDIQLNLRSDKSHSPVSESTRSESTICHEDSHLVSNLNTINSAPSDESSSKPETSQEQENPRKNLGYKEIIQKYSSKNRPPAIFKRVGNRLSQKFSLTRKPVTAQPGLESQQLLENYLYGKGPGRRSQNVSNSSIATEISEHSVHSNRIMEFKYEYDDFGRET